MTTDSTPTPAEPQWQDQQRAKLAAGVDVRLALSKARVALKSCRATGRLPDEDWKLATEAIAAIEAATPPAAAEIAQPATHAEVLTDEQIREAYNRSAKTAPRHYPAFDAFNNGAYFGWNARAAIATQAAQQQASAPQVVEPSFSYDDMIAYGRLCWWRSRLEQDEPAPMPGIEDRENWVAAMEAAQAAPQVVESDNLLDWEEAQQGAAAKPKTLYVYRWPDGRTQVRAPDINDPADVIDMLQEALRAMTEGDPVRQQ